jgi:ABC-type branched-subunit amino acid transport system substrate-binding protein
VLLASVKKAADASKGKEVTRDKVLKALNDIDNYEGIMGFPIRFNKKGDVVGVKISVLQVKNGDFDEVKAYPANTK